MISEMSWDHRSFFFSPDRASTPAPASPESITLSDLCRRIQELRDLDSTPLPLSPPSPHFLLEDDDKYASNASLTSLLSSDGSSPPSYRVMSLYEKKRIEHMDQVLERAKIGLDPPSPRVTIDNESFNSCTVVKVDDPLGGYYLVPALNVLKSLGLNVTKSYVSADGPFFLYVFHVTDVMGYKVGTPWTWYQLENRLQQLGPHNLAQQQNPSSSDLTFELELTASYEPNLIPDLVSLLHGLSCTVLSLNFRQYGTHVSAILQLTSVKVLSCPHFFSEVEAAVEGRFDEAGFWVRVGPNWRESGMGIERRLFWLAMDDVYYNGDEVCLGDGPTKLSVRKCVDSGYLVVGLEGGREFGGLRTAQSAVLETMVELGYSVQHGVATPTFQEYYIRPSSDGIGGEEEAEMENVKKWLQFSMYWSSSRQETQLVSMMRERANYLEETMQSIKEESSPPSPLRRVLGLGSTFLRGISGLVKLYVSTQ